MAEPLPTPTEPVEQVEAPAPAAAAAAEPPIENGTAAIVPAPVPDVEMADSNPTPTEPATQVPAVATPVAAATPTPAAPTPSRNSPHPSTSSQAPTQPYPHGSPTRIYLNQHVTPHLLEAMKHLAATEPEKPLKYLSEFLAQKSAELEG